MLCSTRFLNDVSKSLMHYTPRHSLIYRVYPWQTRSSLREHGTLGEHGVMEHKHGRSLRLLWILSRLQVPQGGQAAGHTYFRTRDTLFAGVALRADLDPAHAHLTVLRSATKISSPTDPHYLVAYMATCVLLLYTTTFVTCPTTLRRSRTRRFYRVTTSAAPPRRLGLGRV